MSDKTRKARQVKQRHEESWMAIQGVNAVGVGLTAGRKIGIIVSVSGEAGKIRKQIPARVEGVPVEIQITGEFKAQ